MRRLLALAACCCALVALPCAAQAPDGAALAVREADALRSMARQPGRPTLLAQTDGAPFVAQHRDLFDKAFDACRQALRAKPDDLAVRANLGGLYLWRDAFHRDESGNFEKAIDQFLIVLRNDPGNLAALAYLRSYEVLTRVKRETAAQGMERVRTALQDAVGESPAAANLETLARVMLFDGRLNDARLAAEALHQLAPTAASQLLLGSLELKSAQAEKALVAFQAALKTSPDRVEAATAKLGASQAHKALGDITAADRMLAESTAMLPPPVLEHAARAAGLETPAQLGWFIGRELVATGETGKAASLLGAEDIGRLASETASEKNASGIKRFEANDFHGARGAFWAAARLVPKKAVFWRNAAAASFELGAYQDSLAALRKAEALEPLKNAFEAKQIAISYAVLGDYRAARLRFERAARDFPEGPAPGKLSSATWAVAMAYAIGGWDEAAAAWSRLPGMGGGRLAGKDQYDMFVHVWGGIGNIAERAEKRGARYQSLRHEAVLYRILGEGLTRRLLSREGIGDVRQEREKTLNKIIDNYRRLPLKPVLAPEVQELVQKAQPFVSSAVDDQTSARRAITLYKQIIELAPWWPEGHYTLALLSGQDHEDDELSNRFWLAGREVNVYLALVPEGADAVRARELLERSRQLIVPLGEDRE